MRCSACNSPYHEASGHRFTDKTRLCGGCAKDFVKWVKGQTKRRWGGVRFYDYAFPPKDQQNQINCCKGKNPDCGNDEPSVFYCGDCGYLCCGFCIASRDLNNADH